MSGSPVVNGLMVVLSITTTAVFLYPIVKLAPSWRERSRHRKIVLQRQAAAPDDPVPGEAVAAPKPPHEIDAAA